MANYDSGGGLFHYKESCKMSTPENTPSPAAQLENYRESKAENQNYISDGWEYAEKHSHEDSIFYLYKENEGAPMNRRWSACGKFQEQLPDADELRAEFGPGLYKFTLINKSKNVKNSRQIQVAKRLKDEQSEPKPSAPQLPQLSGSGDLLKIIETIGALVAALKPLFSQGGNDSSAAVMSLMTEQVKQMGQFQSDMMKNQFEQLMDVVQKQKEETMSTPSIDAIPKVDGGTIDKIVGIIDTYLPLLMRAPATVRRPLIDKARESQEFQQVSASPEAIAEIKKRIATLRDKKQADLVDREFFPKGDAAPPEDEEEPMSEPKQESQKPQTEAA